MSHYRIHNIRVRFDAVQEDAVRRGVLDRIGGAADALREYKVVRRSVDARHNTVHFVYTVDVFLTRDVQPGVPPLLPPPGLEPLEVKPGVTPLSYPPVIIGAGPSGLFASYLLAKHGFAPLVLERGGDVAARKNALLDFHRRREPNPECNALFGLGGAGTFSDGKLTTGIRHPWLPEVLRVLVECGAGKDILIDAKPHIGTDVLAIVVENMVAEIERMGGRVITGCCVNGLESSGGALTGVKTVRETFPTKVAVLAIGHSARDTWKKLQRDGVRLEPKPFQMGIRVEHPQEWINEVQYGEAAGHHSLGAADYKLATRISGRPVFSFCMCPGGETMATVSEPGFLAINGMSQSRRNSPFASSGLVTTLTPDDCGVGDVDSLLKFQRALEKACFETGGGDYTAPAERLVDFEKGVLSPSKLGGVSYRLGVIPAGLHDLFPENMALPLRGALRSFDRALPGYLHPDAIALGPESRASSPVRMLRDADTLQCVTLAGLFPAGEGAGYAGGIMSSALDGLNVARKIIECFSPKMS